MVNSESAETRIAPEKISSVFLSRAGEETPRGLRVVYQDGSRYSGELQKVEKGALVLKVPGVAEMLRLPLEGLRSLVILTGSRADAPAKDAIDRAARDPGSAAHGQAGRRQREAGLELPGVAARSRARPPARLRQASRATSSTRSRRPLFRSSSRLTCSNRQADHATQMQMQLQWHQAQEKGPGRMALRFMNAMAEPSTTAAAGQPGEERRSLYLRDGDVIPSVVTKIDENGVWFRSSLSASTFVSNEKVKADRACPRTAEQHRRRCGSHAPSETGCSRFPGCRRPIRPRI